MRNLIPVFGQRRFAGRWAAVIALTSGLALAGSVAAQEKSLLWRVSRDGKSIYLLGSIHYLRQSNYPLNPTILKALDGSKRLVLETDLNSRSEEHTSELQSPC